MTGVFYKPGSWNVHCDVCGFKFKSDQIKKRWDGLMVCGKDWEHDHPQKFLRVREDKQSVPFVREQNDDTFLTVCYLWDRSSYADLASADCAVVGNTTLTAQYLYQLKYGMSLNTPPPIVYTFDGWFVPQYA